MVFGHQQTYSKRYYKTQRNLRYEVGCSDEPIILYRSIRKGTGKTNETNAENWITVLQYFIFTYR